MNQPDYTDRLLDFDNIEVHYGDSKEFDFKTIKDDIDLFFIDADHSYTGVYNDTKNVFKFRKKDSFVIWHDFEVMNWQNSGTTAPAVKEALGEKFKNVYLIDNRSNICGIYIPEKYQGDFEYHEVIYE